MVIVPNLLCREPCGFRDTGGLQSFAVVPEAVDPEDEPPEGLGLTGRGRGMTRWKNEPIDENRDPKKKFASSHFTSTVSRTEIKEINSNNDIQKNLNFLTINLIN